MPYRDRAGMAGRQWEKIRPDLDRGAMVLVGRLAEAAELIAAHHSAPFMAQYGLKTGEFDALATLRRAGPPFALTPTQLYEATMLSSGAMTNRIDRLEKLGLVARQPNPDDRRGTFVTLTDKGKTLIDSMIEAHVANKERIVSTLDATEQAELSRLLAKLIVAVDPASPDFIGGPEGGKKGKK